MTMFEQPVLSEESTDQASAPPVKRPSRWSPSNWAVRWKVLAIVAIPLALAVAFGGIRVYNSVTDARDLRQTADRTAMVASIEDYTGTLESALLAYSAGPDGPVARKAFDDSRSELARKLSETNVDADVRAGVTSLLNDGPALLDKVASNTIGLRDTVTTYAPILLTAEDTIVASVRVRSEHIRTQAQGLSRAVGARGQMLMQKLLVNRGGEIPEPELRTSMITLAGTEPSTLFGMSQVLGVGSPDAKALQDQMLNRMATMSDPAAALVGNADLLRSLQATEDIANKVISDTTSAVTSAVNKQASSADTAAIRDTIIVAAALLIALLLVLLVARSLVRPLRRLRESALRVAHEDLPAEVERIGSGEQPGPIQPIPVYTTEEIGQVAHAVDDLHEQALLMAAEQARLQLHVSDMFETMSRRSRSLVDQQLALIDDLERNEDDPQRLDALFKLDHLAARMRRSGANLLVLAGSKARREQGESMPIASVISAAASQVEDYQRVNTTSVADNSIVGAAAGDVVHLLAELLDNALRYSPPSSQVRVSAVHTGDRGLVIEVADSGLGMTEGDMRMANMRVESGGEVTPYSTRHMGLFVTGRLAQRHGLAVRLRNSIAGDLRSGTTAGVFIPAELLERPLALEGAASRYDDEAPAAEEFDDLAAVAPSPSAFGESYRNGSSHDEDVLPRRNPGASGIVGPVEDEPAADVAPEAAEPPPTRTRPPSSPLGDTDVIFQRMVSEWLIDPQEIMPPIQSWESVWDSGWAAAEQADEAPVEQRTEQGLPVREPGARLVPGSADSGRPNGASHRKEDDEEAATGPLPRRDPDAVRASLSGHWGGVRAGRSDAREDRQDDE